MKTKGSKFLKEINKKKIYQISIVTNKEIIGLEEFYFGLPYIMRASVLGNKISCYKIENENFKKILYQERQIVYIYVRASINKIKSLIERLQNLKINQIKLIKNKFENGFSDSNDVNNVIELRKKNYLNKIENKMPKAALNLISTNLNSAIGTMSIKTNILNKLNISNLNNSLDKNTNFSTAQFNKGEPLIKQYNSYFVKKTNENKKNNLVSKEDILSASENNTSITKRENKDTISINSNRKSTRNNKSILLNYPRILSYGNFIDKINNNIKLNYQSLSGFDNIYKTNQTNSLIKKKLSIKYSTKGKNIFNHRKNNFNKKISKHSFEKVNNNEQKDISIWSRKKTRQLNKIKSISMDSLLLNYKDQNDNN